MEFKVYNYFLQIVHLVIMLTVFDIVFPKIKANGFIGVINL